MRHVALGGHPGVFSVAHEPHWVTGLRRRHQYVGPAVRSVVTVGVTWLPLTALALSEPRLVDSFAGDLNVHARLLVSIPAFIFAERLVAARQMASARQFVRSGLVPEEQLPRFEALKARVRRLANADAVPLSMFIVSLALSWVPYVNVPEWRAAGSARLWHDAVSAHIFRFLLLRWLWWIALWGYFVVRTSQMRLRILVTHPDGKCGIRFLSEGLTSFFWIALAIGAPVVAQAYARGDLTLGPHHIPHYLTPLAVVAGAVVLAVFGPVIWAYSGLVRQAKRLDMLRFSALVANQAATFQRIWFDSPEREALMEAPDFSATIDLQETYRRSESLSWLPTRVWPILVVASGAFVPAIPLLLLDHELLTVCMKVFETLH